MQQMQNLDLLIDYATQLIQTHPDRQKIFQTVEIKEKWHYLISFSQNKILLAVRLKIQDPQKIR